MDDHKVESPATLSTAYKTPQTFRVYKDISNNLNRDGSSQAEASSLINGSPRLAGLQDEHRASHKTNSSSIQDTDHASGPGFRSSSLHVAKVLADSPLKANSTPRSSSYGSFTKSSSIGPGSGQKRRLYDPDMDGSQKPPKLRHTGSISNADRLISFSDQVQIELGAHGEPPPSGVLARPSKFKEASMNDRYSKHPPVAIIASDMLDSDHLTVDSKSIKQSHYTSDGGEVYTRPTSTTHSFSSAISTWNPLKAMSNFFYRSSNPLSPEKYRKESLSSEEVAEQVEAHLERFEGRIFDRLVAFQAGEQQNQPEANSTSRPNLSISTIEREVDSLSSKESSGHPLLQPEQHLSLVQDLSPMISTSQAQDVELGSGHQHATEGLKASRNPFGTILRSPNKTGRTLRGSISPIRTRISGLSHSSAEGGQCQAKGLNFGGSVANLLRTHDALDHYPETSQSMDILRPINHSIGSRPPSHMEFKELPELPRLKNKASQHLKKMASKMNLRSRKPRHEDNLSINSREYRVMKKKNKDEILKDYMALQKEKQELEKQLAEGLIQTGVPSAVSMISTFISSPEEQIRRDMASAELRPVLLAATTPDFRIKKRESEPSNSEEEEQTRVKRPTEAMPSPVSPGLSPLKLIDDDESGIQESCDDVSPMALKELQEAAGSKKLAEDKTELSVPDETAEEIDDLLPIPTVPTKYRSKVPRRSQGTQSRRANRKPEEWKGWDEDVF